ILQSYFDGELSHAQMESATSHLAECVTCAAAARVLEHENSLVASALAPEFESPVPTELLRQRIDEAIAGLRVVDSGVKSSTSGWFQSLAALFTFTPQRTFGYAGLAVVLALAVLFGIIWREAPTSSLNPDNAVAEGGKATPISKGAGGEVATVNVTPLPTVAPAVSTQPTQRDKSNKPRFIPASQAEPPVKLLPGERSYLKTIAALDSTIKSKGARPMRPSLQAEYERNLAVVNRALAATRSAAKKNPNDPDTAEFMFAAYQSKVDLLSTVADARVYNRQP
ncbi:MAG: anti-sigma factor family protein, partial [Pyrinomonadaceae bacterium]